MEETIKLQQADEKLQVVVCYDSTKKFTHCIDYAIGYRILQHMQLTQIYRDDTTK